MTAKNKLSEETIAIIKSTVPVLAEHGEAITKQFYHLLFTNHPELLHMFNHVNQSEGKQQRALAQSIYAAAAHIDKLDEILPVVKQIAHKHRSLQVKAEHYPIVGKYLLIAMKDVLQEAATDEILDAWGEAYSVIADVFIAVEKEMYEEAENQAGGWEGFRSFLVIDKVKESEVITSFYLQPADGERLASYRPGQYVSVKAIIEEEEYNHIRQYSLSEVPGRHYYRISVKREDGRETPAGIVSNYLHHSIEPGDKVELTAPAGDFFFDKASSRPAVFLSGGVGQTPLVSMFKTAAEDSPTKDITYIHAALNSSVHAFDQEIRDTADRNEKISYYLCYELPNESDKQKKVYDKEGFIDEEWLNSLAVSRDAEFYFCGPLPFMKAMYSILKEWGVPEERTHFEFFGPSDNLEREDNKH
ncbi:NO-inducible flavohemoprotein [Thalassorhabdus alkalitolerans]|uniref:Flavohemoprotein n=1 Tax=Thalassorhabdus alkalitolerans TaxID=2282697 RepID=A0ABW0YKW7_9BACI